MSKTAVLGYCVSCKERKRFVNPQIVTTKNNKMRIAGQCDVGHKMSRFISQQEANGSGLLGSLLGFKDGRVPILSDLPLIGSLI